LEDIDRIIATIKKSKDRDEAKINLEKHFRFTERQAIAILEMRLQQLANLERIRLEEELKEKKKRMKELEDILLHPKKILKIIQQELNEIKEHFGDPRKTKIIPGAVDNFSQEDLIPNEPIVVLLTRDGYIKLLTPEAFKKQGRGGKGVVGLTTKEEDVVEQVFSSTTHTDILFFTNRGRVFQLKAYEIPSSSRTAKGQSIVNFLELKPDEKVFSMFPLHDIKKDKYLVMVTRKGLIKKVDIKSFEAVRKNGLIAITLKDDDRLLWTITSTGNDDIILVSARGQSIRFKEKAIRSTGRTASGVRGMRLAAKDEIIGMGILQEDKSKKTEIFVLTENGFGKKTPLLEYKVQGRGGRGIKTAQVTEKTGAIVDVRLLENILGDIILISRKGQVIRFELSSIPSLGRATQGVRLMRFKDSGDKIASVTLLGDETT